MLTETEIAFRLGLKPWQQIEDEAKASGDYPRRSGRSTRMMVQAVTVAQKEKVCITAQTGRLAWLYAREAQEMCSKIGIDPLNIEWRYKHQEKPKGVIVFRDHWLGPDYPDS